MAQILYVDSSQPATLRTEFVYDHYPENFCKDGQDLCKHLKALKSYTYLVQKSFD